MSWDSEIGCTSVKCWMLLKGTEKLWQKLGWGDLRDFYLSSAKTWNLRMDTLKCGAVLLIGGNISQTIVDKSACILLKRKNGLSIHEDDHHNFFFLPKHGCTPWIMGPWHPHPCAIWMWSFQDSKLILNIEEVLTYFISLINNQTDWIVVCPSAIPIEAEWT